MNVVDLDTFRRAPAAHSGAVLRKFVMSAVAVAVDVEKRQATFVISNATPDREEDVIQPKGIDVTQYKRNPVLLWAHNVDAQNLPVGKCVEGPAVDAAGDMKATFQFSKNALANDVWDGVQEGSINAVSIGFRPLVDGFKSSDRKTAAGWNGLDFSKVELLEVSVVPVPCNPDALLEGKAFGRKDGEPGATAADLLASIKSLLDAQTAQLIAAFTGADEGEEEPAEADPAKDKAASKKTKAAPQKLSKAQFGEATKTMKAASAMLALHHQVNGSPDGEDDGTKASKGASPHRLTKSQMSLAKACVKGAAELLDMHSKADGAPGGEEAPAPDDAGGDAPPADDGDDAEKGLDLNAFFASPANADGIAKAIGDSLNRTLNKRAGKLD